MGIYSLFNMKYNELIKDNNANSIDFNKIKNLIRTFEKNSMFYSKKMEDSLNSFLSTATLKYEKNYIKLSPVNVLHIDTEYSSYYRLGFYISIMTYIVIASKSWNLEEIQQILVYMEKTGSLPYIIHSWHHSSYPFINDAYIPGSNKMKELFLILLKLNENLSDSIKLWIELQ